MHNALYNNPVEILIESTVQKPPEGIHPAKIVAIYDLGTVEGWDGNPVRQISLTYRLNSEHGESDISQCVKATTAPRSTLLTIIEAAIGPVRSSTVPLHQLVGKAVAVEVVHKTTSRGSEIAVVGRVTRLRHGVPPAGTGLIVWKRSSGHPPPASMPTWVRKKMTEWADAPVVKVAEEAPVADESPDDEPSEGALAAYYDDLDAKARRDGYIG